MSMYHYKLATDIVKYKKHDILLTNKSIISGGYDNWYIKRVQFKLKFYLQWRLISIGTPTIFSTN